MAITFVMFAHGVMLGIGAYPFLRYVTIIFGVLGVEFFFVLSGFLIGRQLLDVATGEQTVKSFWWRRWFRTLPNYYIFLAANAILYATILQRPAGDYSFVVFSHALVTPFSSTFFGESWSLAVEEWFYLLAPIFVVACSRLLPRRFNKFVVLFAMTAIILGCLIARFSVAQSSGASIDSTLRKIVMLRLDALAFGVVLAWLERYQPPVFAGVSRLWWCGLLGILIAAGYLGQLAQYLAFFEPIKGADRTFAPLLFTLLPLSSAMLLAAMAAAQMPERRWVVNHSKWAYSTYLLHMPLLLLILSVSNGFTSPVAALWVFALWYAATVAGAAVIYRYYERPIMNLRERFVPLTL